MADHRFRPRDAKLDADVEEFAPLVMPVRRLDDHAATGDAVEEGVELGDFRFDARRHRVG